MVNIRESAKICRIQQQSEKSKKYIGFSDDKYLGICQNLQNSAKIGHLRIKLRVRSARTVSGPESPFRLQKTANMTPATQTAHPPAALRNSGVNCESEDYTLIGELILQSVV